jgi:TonB family protein
MTFTFEQLVESILILMVFYLAYRLLLSNQASFATNRIILLSGILSSILFPLVDLNAVLPDQLKFYIRLKAVEIFPNGSEASETSSYLSFSQLVGCIYWIGVTLLIIRLIYQFVMMFRLFKSSEIVKKQKVRIVYTKKEHSAFSFLSCVFIDSKSEQCNDLDIILNHERVHIVQRHSIDLLLLELLAIVQWFNPIVWLYRKLVKQNHEFLADRGVIKAGVPDDNYQELLLGNYKGLKLGFANSFNHSLTFKRLVMMRKNNSKKLSVLKTMLIIPILMMGIYLISCSKKQEIKEDLQKMKVVKGQENQIDSEMMPPPPPPPPVEKINANDVFESNAIEVKPIYPGGDVELIKYVAQNTVYPKQAVEKGIEGTVYIRFVVTKTGEIANATVMRSVDPLLEAEAIRVVKSLPKWKPGMHKSQPVNVWFIMPVKFKLK